MMTRLAALAAAAVLAGCASPAAYSDLQAAEAALAAHDKADIYLNVDLAETGGAQGSEAQVRARLVKGADCGDRFREGFVATLNEASTRGADALPFAIGRARELDGAFDACARQHGLTGYPEFKLGETFLRTQAFMRSYYDAGMRHGHALQQMEAQRATSTAAFAAGLGAIGRSASAQPAAQPLPAPSIQQPIRCTSYRYGMYVNTTCN